MPVGGYSQPRVGFLARWGLELFINSAYVIGGAVTLIGTSATKRRFLLLTPGTIAIVAGIVFHNTGLMSTYTLSAIGALILGAGVHIYIRRSKPEPSDWSHTSQEVGR
jgi:hypothetical protein